MSTGGVSSSRLTDSVAPPISSRSTDVVTDDCIDGLIDSGRSLSIDRSMDESISEEGEKDGAWPDRTFHATDEGEAALDAETIISRFFFFKGKIQT